MLKFSFGGDLMEFYVKGSMGTDIYVHDINPGGNRTILFLHGWPLNHKAYEYQFIELPYMGYRCIALDMRGFGRSGKPYIGYSYDMLADDVRAVVEALHLNDFTLVGHSMGGATAIRYMARHAGYGVNKLILIAAAAPSVTKRPDFPFGIQKEDVTKIIQDSLNDRPKMLTNLNAQFFYQQPSEPFLSWFTGLGLEAAGWSVAQCAATFRDEFLYEDLKRVVVPTLILHGIHDQVCLFQLAEVMHNTIKSSILVPFDYSGHGIFYEERNRVNAEIAKFVG